MFSISGLFGFIGLAMAFAVVTDLLWRSNQRQKYNQILMNFSNNLSDGTGPYRSPALHTNEDEKKMALLIAAFRTDLPEGGRCHLLSLALEWPEERVEKAFSDLQDNGWISSKSIKEKSFMARLTSPKPPASWRGPGSGTPLQHLPTLDISKLPLRYYQVDDGGKFILTPTSLPHSEKTSNTVTPAWTENNSLRRS